MPQLLEMPPILAHTIFQVLEFDEVLRGREYRPRGLKSEWKGLSEIILGKREWYSKWLEGERECECHFGVLLSDKPDLGSPCSLRQALLHGHLRG